MTGPEGIGETEAFTGEDLTKPFRNACRRHARPLSFLLYTALYCLLGGISFSTAYVQANAATVWLPTGFAIGLLLARGTGLWPAVSLGSFLLNATVNLVARDGLSLAGAGAVALCIAAGNTLEALIGADLARRFSGGRNFLMSSRGLITFAMVVAPLAALVSATVGVAASWFGGITTPGGLLEGALTWYVANAVGILMFTGPTILLLEGKISRPQPARMPEALLLLACLIFVSQAISGIYLADALNGWVKSYMVIPLLFWASFRFGVSGALSSVVIVVAVSTIGTLRGFQVFSAETPSRSLLYLQIFLAMLSLMALSIAATRAQVAQLQANLEARVRDRTAEVERLLKEKEVFTTVVAHDLQSPLYGVRNALRAAVDAVAQGRIDLTEAAAAMTVMEETCTALAKRVAVLLAPEPDENRAAPAAETMRIVNLVANIVAAHRLAIDRKVATVTFAGDKTLAIRRPVEVEHILDILIENAIRYSPPGSTIDVAVHRHGGTVDILVSDNGDGVAAREVPRLFLRRASVASAEDRPRHGLGLHLASQLAAGLGGTLTYSPAQPVGSRFRLTLQSSLAGEVNVQEAMPVSSETET